MAQSDKEVLFTFIIGMVVGMIIVGLIHRPKTDEPTIYDCLQLGSDYARTSCLEYYGLD